MLQFPLWAMEIIYMICLVGLSIYGFNSLIMIFLYFRAKNQQKGFREDSSSRQESFNWPDVTIQIPIFNERYTIERLLKALYDMDYPAEKLQVQVLDDSTDQTYLIVSSLVERMQMQGLNIQHIHRDNRSGYKAGALTEGLRSASGEFIALFDADFVPSADWLKLTIPFFQNKSLGCLQTRWGHLNSNYDAFTRAISLGIDGHFVVEQTARAKNGLFLNFNGTAGVWRRTCIEDAGGWTIDTLTEDLDLSYRAQLKGWKIDYLPQVVVPAELPVQVEAFKKQQYRWAKGSFQTVRKLVPLLLKADLPEFVRLEGLIHITGYLVHPLMLATLLLMLPMGWFAPQFLKFFPFSMMAAFGPPLMYLVSQTENAPRLIDRLSRLPLMVLIGFGLSVNNSIAVFQGLFSREIGTFVRTPKFNLLNQKGGWARSAYVMPLSRMVWVELSLAIYSMLTIYLLLPKVGLGIAPWMLVYTCAYLYIALTNIIQNLQADTYQQQVRSPVSNRS